MGDPFHPCNGLFQLLTVRQTPPLPCCENGEDEKEFLRPEAIRILNKTLENCTRKRHATIFQITYNEEMGEFPLRSSVRMQTVSPVIQW